MIKITIIAGMDIIIEANASSPRLICIEAATTAVFTASSEFRAKENSSSSKQTIKTIKLEKPKKQKPYKMTEAEIIQMMFSNKEIKEQLNQL